MTALVYALLWGSLLAGTAADPLGLSIESPSQTATSVYLAWETDQPIRTLKVKDAWEPSTPTAATHRAVLAPGEGRQGSTAAKVTGTASADNARGCFIRGLGKLPPETYHYSLWCKTANQRDGGTPRLLIDCYLGQHRTYHELVQQDLPSAEAWREAAGTFTLPADAQETRILLYQVGAGTTWFDDVELRTVWGATNLLPDGGFDGVPSWRVFFRKQGEEKWQAVEAVVLERFHNVLFLQPQTTYQFKVEWLPRPGKVEATSQVLTVATRAVSERSWNGLRLGPSRRTPTPPAVYPCVRSVADKLYYAESRGGSLWLSALSDESR